MTSTPTTRDLCERLCDNCLAGLTTTDIEEAQRCTNCGALIRTQRRTTTMSAIRTLKRSIRERETGKRGVDKPKRVEGAGRTHGLKHRLEQRLAKAARERARA